MIFTLRSLSFGWYEQADLVIVEHMPEPIVDFRQGEAQATFAILQELSKHIPTPISICGSNIKDRPSINVTLKAPIGDADVLREYKTGRSITIHEKRNHETEHFAFEWIAPS